ncbi:hypothetical protein I4U23_027593 [Adineta vaga]|nr:hypothetical protein I4U23_027593 [Adineta vaga]
MKLSATLENKNFSPRDQDKIDLRDIVIDLFVILKERGQAFEKSIQEEMKKFFRKENDRYIEKIDEIDETLRTDSRNIQVANELGLALNDRLTWLTNIRKLIPDLLSFNNLDILLKQFEDTNKQNTLNNTRIQLEYELNSTVDCDKAMDIIYELDDVLYELDYCTRKVEASKMININDLIILLGYIAENAELSNRDKLSLGALKKLIEAGQITENIEVSLAIIKIFKFIDMSKFSDIERTLDEILPTIPFDQRKLIEDLSRKLILREYPSVLKYFYRILIENEDKQVRDDTLKILQQCIDIDIAYISDAIRLENKCLSDDSSIVDDCLEYVKKKNRLTLNCFEKLTKYFHMNEKLELIIEIIELEIQILPKFFIEKCHEYIELSLLDTSTAKNIISLSKSLVKTKQMSLKNIPNIDEFILQHLSNFRNDIFDLLYAEYQNGYDISKSILDRLNMSENNNNYSRNLNLLKNSRNDLEIRKIALENLIKEEENSTLDTINILQSLIKYDIDLRSDAFKVLIKILPHDFNIDWIEIGRSIEHDHNISIDDITQFIIKDPQNENLIVFLPMIIDRIQTHDVYVNETSKQVLILLIQISNVKQNENLLSDKLPYLLEVAFRTIHDEVRESIVKMIKNSIIECDQHDIQILKYKNDGTTIESFLPDELYKLECCQILDFNTTALENLRKLVQEGYGISEKQIQCLIDVLTNKHDQNFDDIRSKISEILFEINLKQGLTNTNINRITEHTELLKSVMVIGILAVCLSRNMELSEEIIKQLWEQLLLIDEEKDEKLKKYLFYATVKIAIQKKNISMKVVEKCAKLLEQKNEKSLIEKQNLCQFHLEILNDVLLMLIQLNEIKAWNIIMNDCHFQICFIKLRELWLKKQLKQFHIEQLRKLNEYLPYRIKIIHFVLSQLIEDPNIDELIQFFIQLFNCNLTIESKEYFLINKISNKINLKNLQLKFNEQLIEILLSKKFTFYSQYFHDTQNYHFRRKKTSIEQNAYNQAETTYCYKAEDIAIILIEWMKEFDRTKFRITQPLGKQEERNLYDVLKEYKQDHRTTIIPLNIANNHWISLALIYNEKKKENIVLYKDSMGEHHSIVERIEIQNILTKQLKNVNFKFHRSCDQFDDYNCGVFTLANMKSMAENLSKQKQKLFINNFDKWNFITQKQVIELRHKQFPKIYVLSLFQSYKQRKMVNYHSVELKFIKDLLENNEHVTYPITTDETEKFENGLRISICLLSQEEDLINKNNSEYLYVIEASEIIQGNEIDFRQESKLKKNIKHILKINEIYSTEKNRMKILDRDLIGIEKRKLNSVKEFINEISDDEIEEILNQICVEINSTNKQILYKNLDLNNQIIDINKCELIKKLHGKLIKILHSGWTLKSIQQIINYIDSNEDIKHLFDALDPIYEYRLKEFDNNIQGKMLIDILTSILSEDLTEQIHDLAIFQTFQRSYDKNFQELIEEILDLNPNQTISFIDEKKITEEYENIQSIYRGKSVLYPNSNCIQQWSTSDIQQWTEDIKKPSNSVTHHEKIAIVMKAIEITSKFPVREIQVLSLLILINSEQKTGRLVQINTGEGKTTIVAMLAAIKALDGHHVDVVTSSPELAKPQSIQLKEFYQQFNLTVSHNGKDLVDIKIRYTADIVYGAASDFQGDILRDEYSKLGTRNGRKCDVAIVDEVDSMLIDERNHIVMLSSQMPAMDNLEPLLAAIWIQIGEVAKYIEETNGKTYFIEQPDIFDDKGQIRYDIATQAVEIKESKEDFIKNCTEKHLRKLIRDIDQNIPEKYPEIKIPEHLRKLILECQLTKWIDSAIHAKYRCHNQQHYLLRNGKIVPVDASNTGIIQANMHWSNGLHQFLQMKHGAKICAESFTTNFISNVTYFRRYGSNLFGLTGTLGSQAAQKLLSEIYKVDNVIIPPFRKKQYQELTPIIVNNVDDWYENIIESSMNKLKNGRGVLIITKYIQEVDEIKNRLIKANYDQSKIKTYRTGDESKILEEELTSGEIIIATNIAGRGTDIRADKIEKYGGLHVLVTFLPPNQRVEQQNVGRTSRTGNKGTGQFILLQQDENNYLNLKTIRDEQEEIEIGKAVLQIDEVTIKDAVFEEFCKLLTNINGNDDIQTKEKKIKLRAVEDRFGIWLKMQESTKTITKDEMLRKFKEFEQEILKDNAENTLIRNPCFHVLIGNECLKKKDAGKNQEAIEEFTKAIKLDEHFQVNAYYNRGYALLAEYGKDCKRNKDKIDAAIKDFKRAKQIIEENLEPMLHVIQQTSISDALSEQLRCKMLLFSIQKYTIELAIGNTIEEVNNEEQEHGCIDQARKDNYDIEVEYLDIEQLLPRDQDITLYSDEIEEYRNNGFFGSFKIKGLKPIDWSAVIIVASLGIVQIVAGAALAVYTAGIGSAIGTALIAEGVSDLIIIVQRGIINRDFDWKSYGIQKAISLTVAIVCVGFGAMLDVAKTVLAGVSSIGTVMTTTVKTGWILAAKAIAAGLAKGIAKELITQLVDHGVSKSLMPIIQDEVMKRVEKPIQNALLINHQVKKMLQLDEKNRNNYYERLIRQKAMKLFHSTEQQSALKTITIGIVKGIATQKISGLSAVLKAVQVKQTLEELDKFVPNFIEKLNEVVENIYKEEKLDEKETQNYKKLEQQQQQHTTSEQKRRICMKEEDTLTYVSTYIPETSSKDIDLKNVPEPEQVNLGRENKSFDDLYRALARNVSQHICNIIQRKLIVLVTDVGINHSMTLLTADLDRNIQFQINNYQAQRRIEFFQDGDRNNRIPNEFKYGADDPKAVKKVEDMVRDLKDGGEAGLPHLGSLSDETGRSIKVFDDKGQVIRIIGENKSGDPIEVQYHKPTIDNPQGHWTLPDSQEPMIRNGDQNNCLFNVIAQQTGKDPNQLRNDIAIRMENNKANLANQAHDIERLEQYKKDALIMGGFKHHLGEERFVLDGSQGVKPHGSNAAGHPNDHIQGNLSHDKIAKKQNHTNFVNKNDQTKCFREGMEYIIGNQCLSQDPQFVKAEVTFPLKEPVLITDSAKNKDTTYALADKATLVLHNKINDQNEPDLCGPTHLQTIFGHPASSESSPNYKLTVTRINSQTKIKEVETTTHIPDDQWPTPKNK